MIRFLSICFLFLSMHCFGQYDTSGWSNKAESHQDLQSAKKQAEANPNDAAAWEAYYIASRFNFWSGPHKSLSKQENDELNKIAIEMNTRFPGSNEAAYVNYQQNQFTAAGVDFIKNLDPRDKLLAEIDAAYTQNDFNLAQTRCVELKNQGAFSQDLIDYHKATLLLLPRNAIFITNGFYDTYPALICQMTTGLRSDVTIVPLDYLEHEGFRERIASKLEYKASYLDTDRTKKFRRLMNANTGVVHASLMLPASLLNEVYGGEINGLSYSIVRLDRERLWKEIDFYLLYKDLNPAAPVNRNHLPMMVSFYHHLMDQGKEYQAKDVKQLAESIAENHGFETLIAEMLLRE